MKRFISVVLTCILILTMLPIGTFAAETDTTRQDLEQLACTIFPEYADTIRGENIGNVRSVASNDLVICITRPVSEDATMTYTEYANGIAVATYCSHTLTITESKAGTGYAYRKADIKMICNASSQYLYVKGLEYTFVQNGYDTINNAGSTSQSTTFAASSSILSATETASNFASASYYGAFVYDYTDNSINMWKLTVSVGNDMINVSKSFVGQYGQS